VSIGTELQVVCQAQLAKKDGVPFEKQHENLRRGDVIGIVGYPGRTNPKNKPEGELSIFATQVTLLSPCLHMLPGVRFPFSDGEQRCAQLLSLDGRVVADLLLNRARMRYLDLLWNDKSREALWQRSRMVRFIRDCRSKRWISTIHKLTTRYSLSRASVH